MRITTSGSRKVVLGVAAAALAAGLTACAGQTGAAGATPVSGGTPVTSGSVAANGPATAPSPNAVNPNAPEVNAAGDIPDNQVFVPYTPPGAAFRVSVPEGWARTSDGAATVFTDKFNSVRMEVVPRPSAPTVASAQSDELPALSTRPGFAPGTVTAITRKAGPAVLVTYTATSPPDPVTGKAVTEAVERYEFWRNGQEVVLTLAGPQGADNVDPWRTVSDSFGWLR